MSVTTPLGQVLRDSDGIRLEFVRTYQAPVNEVWAALTDPDRVARWIGTWSGDPATGAIELVMSEDEGAAATTVTIVTCESPTSLVLDMPTPDGVWRLSVVLRAADAEVTTLHLTHRLAEPYDATSVGPGWHYYLDRLGAVVADQVVPADWDEYFPNLSSGYQLPA